MELWKKNNFCVGAKSIPLAQLVSVTPTQTTSTGTLAVELAGATTSVVITTTAGAFHSSTDLTVGGTAISAANIASAS